MDIRTITAQLDAWFPPRLAEEWDNVGLLLGDEAASAARVLTCLTLTAAVAEEALADQAELIVSHHPIFFRPIKRLGTRGPEAHLYRLAAAGIAVYSPHTAFDSAAGGINQQIAERLGLTAVRPLVPQPGPAAVKLVVFVPEGDLEPVSQAVFAAGAGVIGNYRECSFRVAGTGTFFGTEAAQPVVGQKGRRETVAETRLEVVLPADRVAAVVAAVRAAHSYEEPAFDLYPLQGTPTAAGAGRVGDLSAPQTLDALGRRVRSALGATLVQRVGDGGKSCQRVAVACGAGDDFVKQAVQAGADVLVTGEARFHRCLEAEAAGVGLLLPGHYASERFAVESLADRLATQFPALTVWPSRRERDPLAMVE